MQINAYNNLLSSLSSGLNQSGQIDKNASSGSAKQAAELGKGFGKLLEAALVEPDGRDAVAAARVALADGTLDRQEAFESAAESLLNGI